MNYICPKMEQFFKSLKLSNFYTMPLVMQVYDTFYKLIYSSKEEWGQVKLLQVGQEKRLGHFKKGLLFGKGLVITPTTIIFGYFNHGQLQNKCAIVYVNGDIHIANFKNNEIIKN